MCKMKKYIGLIEKSSLLGSLTMEKIIACLKDGSFRISTYGKNNILHFSSEACLTLEIILSGHVSVERIDEAGNLMTIAEFYGDEILGVNLLFSKSPYYPMTITAKQATVISEIDKERLLTLFSDSPVFLRRCLEFVADHTTILGERIKHYANKTIRECVMAYLEHEQQKQNWLPITQKALAERIGVSHTSLLRELAKMKKDGAIHYDAKCIGIL